MQYFISVYDSFQNQNGNNCKITDTKEKEKKDESNNHVNQESCQIIKVNAVSFGHLYGNEFFRMIRSIIKKRSELKRKAYGR